MRRTKILAALALLFSASAVAQMSGRYADWANGPVHHLMTREEIRQWKAIRSDDDAQAFIDLFWARRDPTPDTPRNEFREAFEARVKAADDQFSNGRERGAMTDPGRVLILLGPPYTVTGRAGAQAISSLGPIPQTAPTDAQGHVLVPGPTREPDRQVWTYAHERKPQFIPQSDFVLLFLDEGHNDWRLAYTERTNPDLILQEAVTGLIVSPKLTKAPFRSDATLPRARSKAFRDLLLEGAYKQFRSVGKDSIGPANLTWGEFVTSAGEHFVSAQLYVPQGAEIAAGQRVNFISVVENPAGEIVDVDESPATMIASGLDAYIDKSLSLDPGSYNATFALFADEKLLTAVRVPLSVDKLDPGAPGISPLLLSGDVYPLKNAVAPMDPFTFGALKVIPKGDSIFAPKGDLWYFLELRNPGLAAEGAPKIRVQIDIEGQTAKGRAEMKFPLADTKATRLTALDNRYALGLAIPLEGFIPGEYTIKIRVVDVVLGKEYHLEKPFRVRG